MFPRRVVRRRAVIRTVTVCDELLLVRALCSQQPDQRRCDPRRVPRVRRCATSDTDARSMLPKRQRVGQDGFVEHPRRSGRVLPSDRHGHGFAMGALAHPYSQVHPVSPEFLEAERKLLRPTVLDREYNAEFVALDGGLVMADGIKEATGGADELPAAPRLGDLADRRARRPVRHGRTPVGGAGDGRFLGGRAASAGERRQGILDLGERPNAHPVSAGGHRRGRADLSREPARCGGAAGRAAADRAQPDRAQFEPRAMRDSSGVDKPAPCRGSKSPPNVANRPLCRAPNYVELRRRPQCLSASGAVNPLHNLSSLKEQYQRIRVEDSESLLLWLQKRARSPSSRQYQLEPGTVRLVIYAA
jgi:hypothetical protein